MARFRTRKRDGITIITILDENQLFDERAQNYRRTIPVALAKNVDSYAASFLNFSPFYSTPTVSGKFSVVVQENQDDVEEIVYVKRLGLERLIVDTGNQKIVHVPRAEVTFLW